MTTDSAVLDAGAPASWALEAARLPLAFAQVREDPRLDLEVLRSVRTPADVVMIASGGETAVCLAREPLGSLTLVDMNPAQLALCRLKLHLAATSSPERNLALLGHREMSAVERQRELSQRCNLLGLPDDAFGPVAEVAGEGPDHVGRYEVLFSHLRGEFPARERELGDALRSPQLGAGTLPLLERTIADALERVMALPNLVALFGADATQNARQPFHRHFAERVCLGMEGHPPATNPFLWQMLAGRFPPGATYDWLESDAPSRVKPRYFQGRMDAVLASMPQGSADMIHLSNILDWLTESQATACLRHAARVLRPGGKVIVRQLNSTLRIPELPSGLQWDAAMGAALHARDRSFFYHAIHIGERP